MKAEEKAGQIRSAGPRTALPSWAPYALSKLLIVKKSIMVGRCGSRSLRPLVTWHPQSGSRQRWLLVPCSPSPFSLVLELKPRDGAAHLSQLS